MVYSVTIAYVSEYKRHYLANTAAHVKKQEVFYLSKIPSFNYVSRERSLVHHL